MIKIRISYTKTSTKATFKTENSKKLKISTILTVISVSILTIHQLVLNNRWDFPQCHRGELLHWSNTPRAICLSNTSYCWFDLHLFLPQKRSIRYWFCLYLVVSEWPKQHVIEVDGINYILKLLGVLELNFLISLVHFDSACFWEEQLWKWQFLSVRNIIQPILSFPIIYIYI